MNEAHEGSLRFSVLGPLRGWRDDREMALGSPQQRVVLAALLLRRGRTVTIAELVDAVWGKSRRVRRCRCFGPMRRGCVRCLSPVVVQVLRHR